RIDKFGVVQPNIQRLGSSGRIMVELPGAKDIERIKNLLQSTAQLEFWHVYTSSEMQNFLVQANSVLKEIKNKEEVQKENQAQTPADTAQVDTTNIDDTDMEALLTEVDDTLDVPENPLFDLMLSGGGGGPILATFSTKDTATVNNYLSIPQVRSLLPANMKYAKFVWGKPVQPDNNFNVETIDLYALKGNRGMEPPLNGNVI